MTHKYIDTAFFLKTDLEHPTDAELIACGLFSALYKTKDSDNFLLCRTIESFKFDYLNRIGIQVFGLTEKETRNNEKYSEFYVENLEDGILSLKDNSVLYRAFLELNKLDIELEKEILNKGSLYMQFIKAVHKSAIKTKKGLNSLTAMDHKVILSIKKSFLHLEKMKYLDFSKLNLDLHFDQFLKNSNGEVFCSDIVCEKF